MLLSITVSPAVASVAQGATQQFTATGHYSDLSTQNLTNEVTWSSTQVTLASVSNAVGSQGLAKGLLPGLSTINATDPSSLLSGTSALTVLPAVLTAITVSPSITSIAQGATQQFTATGLFSDGSTQNLTNEVTWSSTQVTLASVSNAVGSQGLAKGLLPGLATINATDPSSLLSGTSALTVLPAVLTAITVSPSITSIAQGATQQFTATGLFSDGSTQNLTNEVTWSSTQVTLASVSNAVGSQGLAKGLLPGLSTINATDPSSLLSGTSALTVLPAVLTAITVSPSITSIAQGATQQFTATGLFSDGSTQNLTNEVTWSSTQVTLASVSNAVGSQGLAKGLLPGLSTINATDPSSLLSGTSALTVLPAVLTAITVSPSITSIAQGATQQFTATGLFSDGSTQNLTNEVTWSSTQVTLASVSNAVGSQGLAKGLLPGLSTINATDPSSLLSGTSALTVLPAVLTAITVSPSITSIAQGATQQFTATGLFSDGSTQNLTNEVTWSSTQVTLASVSNAVGSQGLAKGLLPGLSTITATDPSTLLGGTGLLTVLSSLVPPPPPTSPALSMTPGSGRARTGVVAHGSDFVPGQPVTVTYMSGLRARKRATTVLCSTTVKSDGTFSCSGAIPRRHRSGKRGQHAVVATGPSDMKGTTTFTLFK